MKVQGWVRITGRGVSHTGGKILCRKTATFGKFVNVYGIEALSAQWNRQNGDPVLGIFAPGADQVKCVDREAKAQCFG